MVVAMITALIVALLTCFLLLHRSALVQAVVRPGDLRARQSSHERPTLRLGGLGIIAGLLVGALVGGDSALLMFLAAALPILFAGLSEDLGFPQSSRARLGFAALSSAIAMACSGAMVMDVGLVGFDALLAFLPVALAFTIFATVGITHAFNLVDGMNGLAGAVALVATLGLAVMCHRAGLSLMDRPAPVMVGALLGFLVLNYPAGWIFLGDTGAYALGFVLAWLSVSAMAEAPEISAWAVVLVFFWPIADTMFAMWRRYRRRIPLDRPDRMHFHHVLRRLVEIRILGRRARRISNPVSTALALPLMIVPALAGVALWDDTRLAILAVAGFAALFVLTYSGCVRLAQSGRRRPATPRVGCLSAPSFARERSADS